MTESEPLRLSQDPESPRELRRALSELPDEMPSNETLGALRLRLTAVVGEPALLKRESSWLGTGIRDLGHAEPSAAQLSALRQALPRQAPTTPATQARRRGPRRLAAAAWLWPFAAAAAIAAAYAFYEHTRTRQPEPVPDQHPSAPFASSTPPVASAGNSASPVASAAEAGLSSATPVASAPPALTKPSELTLLREAQKAVRAEPSKALALANQHARLYPSGLLAQERETVAISALESLGRSAEARARAERFRAAYPGSAYWPRIQHLLGSDAP